MGRLAPRVIVVIAVALSIAVAAPFHALAMQQPCAQMTKDGPAKAAIEQAGETMVGGGDAGSNTTGSGVGALASMDCAQHCSDLGTANPMLGPVRQLADAPPASSVPPLTLVFPELNPLPPRPGAAA